MVVQSSTERFLGGESLAQSVSFSRRELLQGGALSVVPFKAGCSELVRTLSGDPGEITVFNDTGSTVSATVSVTDLRDQTTVLSETMDIEASQARKFNDIFGSATGYRFEIETADGLSESHEWDLPSTNHFLYITIRSDSIEFEENSP